MDIQGQNFEAEGAVIICLRVTDYDQGMGLVPFRSPAASQRGSQVIQYITGQIAAHFASTKGTSRQDKGFEAMTYLIKCQI